MLVQSFEGQLLFCDTACLYQLAPKISPAQLSLAKSSENSRQIEFCRFNIYLGGFAFRYRGISTFLIKSIWLLSAAFPCGTSRCRFQAIFAHKRGYCGAMKEKRPFLTLHPVTPREPFQFALPSELFELRQATPQLPPSLRLLQSQPARRPEAAGLTLRPAP
jgi:hypothetical protein